jgi:DNA-binding transcriptional LysR family regulator
MASSLSRRRIYDLVVFAAAARAGTFSRAAHELAMTQSAVSHHIAGLERDLGLPLFRREWRGVALTAEGTLLLDAVARGAAAMAEGATAVRRIAASRSSLTLVTDFAFAAFWLIPRLGELQAILAGIDVRILTTQSSAALDLTAGDAAIAFAVEIPAGWRATSLIEEIVVPLANPALGPPESIIDYAPLLSLDVPEPGRWITWDGYLAATGHRRTERGGLSFNNYPVLMQAATARQGVALGWWPLVSNLVDSGLLAVAGEPLRTGRRGYEFIEPAGAMPNPAVARVRDWMREEVGREALDRAPEKT